MSDWTAGYVSDIGYTFGYYNELNPLRARLALLAQGIAPPQIRHACELGFGQGLSANLHAASSGVEWHGTDFNPGQAAFANEMAFQAGVSAQWRDDAFAEYCARPEVPDFDFIGLHGIWSWISDQNRQVIVDFVRRKLRVGGVLYISYNTLPGWAAFAPMRHLMVEHAQVMGAAGGGIVSRIDGAIEFTQTLLATSPAFSRANPSVAERVSQMKGQNRQYLAHEYFNKDWHPMHFATAAQWLEPAKLQFACSATALDTIDAVNLTPDQQAFLKQIPDAMFRQTVRDFMVNQQFRRDYWVKGPRSLTAWDQTEALRRERVVLVARSEDVSMKIQGALGEATLNEGVYRPLLQALSDHQIRSIGALEAELVGPKSNITLPQLLQAITMMVGLGHVAAAQQDEQIQLAQPAAHRLNRWLSDRAQSSGDINYLASPVTGGGVVVTRVQQLFLRATRLGQTNPVELAGSAWQTLAAQGHRLIKDGQSLEGDDANLQELTLQARAFLDHQLPALRALRTA